jgi:hypothetical protein
MGKMKNEQEIEMKRKEKHEILVGKETTKQTIEADHYTLTCFLPSCSSTFVSPF